MQRIYRRRILCSMHALLSCMRLPLRQLGFLVQCQQQVSHTQHAVHASQLKQTRYIALYISRIFR